MVLKCVKGATALFWKYQISNRESNLWSWSHPSFFHTLLTLPSYRWRKQSLEALVTIYQTMWRPVTRNNRNLFS